MKFITSLFLLVATLILATNFGLASELPRTDSAYLTAILNDPNVNAALSRSNILNIKNLMLDTTDPVINGFLIAFRTESAGDCTLVASHYLACAPCRPGSPRSKCPCAFSVHFDPKSVSCKPRN